MVCIYGVYFRKLLKGFLFYMLKEVVFVVFLIMFVVDVVFLKIKVELVKNVVFWVNFGGCGDWFFNEFFVVWDYV